MAWFKSFSRLVHVPKNPRGSSRARAGPSFRLGCEELEPRTLLSVGGGFTNGGLLGQYFNNPTLAGTPAFTRTDVRIDYD